MCRLLRGFTRGGMLLACLSLVLLVQGGLRAAEAATRDARTLLRQAHAAFAERPPVAFEAAVVAALRYGSGPVHQTSFTESFRQDGDRLDVYLLQSQSRGEGDQAVDLGTLESRSIWDGSRFINRTTEPGGGDVAYFTRDRSYRDSTRLHDSQCACLDGLLPLGSHFAATMIESGELSVQPERVDVGDVSCYLVEARGPYGRLQAWLDPARGCHFRKLVLWGPAADSTDGGLPASADGGPSLVVENIELEQIGGRWLAVSGTVEERGVVKGGQGYQAHRTMARSNVVWNPDFETLGAFRMDLPEGTRMRNKEDPDTVYVWRNGRPEPVKELHARRLRQPAPPLVLEQWYNTTFWGLELKGKVVLLDFFGVWCRPCMAQIPFIKELWQRYQGQGLVVVGVHTPLQKEGITDFLSREAVSYPVGVDHQGKTAETYQVYGYPTVVLVDRSGVIRAMNPTKEQLERLLPELLQEPPK